MTYLLRFDPDSLTIEDCAKVQRPFSSHHRYFVIEGEAVTIPVFTPEGWRELVWLSDKYTVPIPLKRRPWLSRLVRCPLVFFLHLRNGLSPAMALRFAVRTIRP